MDDFKTFRLMLPERFGLMELLPNQNNFITLGLINGLRNELAITEEDIKKLNIIEKDDKTMWDADKDKGKEIKLGPKLFEIIYKILDDVEKGSQLKSQHYTLFEKIVLPQRELLEKESNLRKK